MGKTGKKQHRREQRFDEVYPQEGSTASSTQGQGQGEWFDDKTLKCLDCQQDFIFTGKDQRFYKAKGFTPPKRCKPCRDKRKAQRPPREVEGQQG